MFGSFAFSSSSSLNNSSVILSISVCNFETLSIAQLINEFSSLFSMTVFLKLAKFTSHVSHVAYTNGVNEEKSQIIVIIDFIHNNLIVFLFIFLKNFVYINLQ
jgi:hypothetical protein